MLDKGKLRTGIDSRLFDADGRYSFVQPQRGVDNRTPNRTDPPPAAARHVVLRLHPPRGGRALGKVLSGKLRLNQVIESSIGKACSKGQITQRLEANFRTLGQLLCSNRDDFRIAVGRRKHSLDDRWAAQRRLARCRRRAASLIEEVAVRMPRLQTALGALRQISERMTPLGRRSGRKCRRSCAVQQLEELHKEVAKLMRVTRETPATLHRRLARIAALSKEHEAVRRALAGGQPAGWSFPSPNATATAA